MLRNRKNIYVQFRLSIVFLFFSFLFVSATYSILNLYEGVENKRHTSVGKSQREAHYVPNNFMFPAISPGQNRLEHNCQQEFSSANKELQNAPNRPSFFFFLGGEGVCWIFLIFFIPNLFPSRFPMGSLHVPQYVPDSTSLCPLSFAQHCPLQEHRKLGQQLDVCVQSEYFYIGQSQKFRNFFL